MTAVLACLLGPDAPGERVAEWAGRLAPDIRLVPVRYDGHAVTRIHSIPRPYALLGAGVLGTAAFELAGTLSAKNHPSAHLLVGDCLPPPGVEPLGCRLTALAGTGHADEMAGWRPATTAPFTLRLLDGFPAPPLGAVSPHVALVLAEELQVWPH